MPESRTFDFVVLAVGVAAVSTAAVIIRETDAPSLVISAARLSLASLPLLLIAGMRRERLVPAERVRWLLTLLSGVMLAFHFAFWITSVQETSVVTSVVPMNVCPSPLPEASHIAFEKNSSR